MVGLLELVMLVVEAMIKFEHARFARVHRPRSASVTSPLQKHEHEDLE